MRIRCPISWPLGRTLPGGRGDPSCSEGSEAPGRTMSLGVQERTGSPLPARSQAWQYPFRYLFLNTHLLFEIVSACVFIGGESRKINHKWQQQREWREQASGQPSLFLSLQSLIFLSLSRHQSWRSAKSQSLFSICCCFFLSCTTAYLWCVRCLLLWFQQGGTGEEWRWMVTGLCSRPDSHHGHYRQHSKLTGKGASFYWPCTVLFNCANTNCFHLKNINDWELPEITMVTYLK